MSFGAYVENAVKWALETLGSEEYRFRCLAFVEEAYEKGNGIEIFGGSTAMESAVEYGVGTDSAIPPRGVFVFYDCSGPIEGEIRNWGHVGLSLGEGKVVHAWDRVRSDHFLEVEKLAGAPGWTSPRCIGWVPVDRIMKGHIRNAGVKDAF